MALRFRRRIKIFPGVTVNISKTGLGLSAGVRGARLSVGADGKVRRSIGIPGSGLSDVTVVGDVSRKGRERRRARKQKEASRAQAEVSSRAPLRPVPLPRSGVFNTEAVAEHRWMERLQSIMERRNARTELEVFAELVHNAGAQDVGVYVDGLQVANLPRAVATKWADQVDTMAADGTMPIASALLTVRTGKVEVTLDLPRI
jgi:hypothetical protein